MTLIIVLALRDRRNKNVPQKKDEKKATYTNNDPLDDLNLKNTSKESEKDSKIDNDDFDLDLDLNNDK
jgi:hypothetical protein